MDHASLLEFKDRQREMWASFTPTATFTTPVAGHLVTFAGVAAGEVVLDVGTGTGVVAISAARAGARVTALDLSPDLLEQARENGRIAQHEEIVWVEGDAEALPYPDESFDIVLSQFGHIFAPRPDVVRQFTASSIGRGPDRTVGRPGGHRRPVGHPLRCTLLRARHHGGSGVERQPLSVAH
jgi:SAM-dependent methyltransferase